MSTAYLQCFFLRIVGPLPLEPDRRSSSTRKVQHGIWKWCIPKGISEIPRADFQHLAATNFRGVRPFSISLRDIFLWQAAWRVFDKKDVKRVKMPEFIETMTLDGGRLNRAAITWTINIKRRERKDSGTSSEKANDENNSEETYCCCWFSSNHRPDCWKTEGFWAATICVSSLE